MKQVIVTTSWDDGHQLDVRLAALLKKYDMKATFYIAPRDHEFDREQLLSDAEVKVLSRDFEIGAHTMTHPKLTETRDAAARQEIIDSKRYLERLIKKTVSTFCYPGGNYKAKHVGMVREAGFRYARTVRRHRYNLKDPLLEAGTTINAYNHYQDLWKIARFARFNPLKTLYYFQWDNLAKGMFDKVTTEGGVYHLWGHSWEIDKHGDWDKLEDVLRYISGNKTARYVTNGELPALQPKRVLIVTPYFPPHLGGVEFYTYNIAKFLEETQGWEVRVVTSGRRGWRVVKTTYDGLTVYRLPVWFTLSNSPLNPLWMGMLRRIMEREDPSVVNVHAPVPGLPDMAAYTARRLRIPLVATYHMVSMAKGRSGLDRLIYTYEAKFLPAMLRFASVIICSSDAVRDTFLRHYRDKSLTITPGVNTALFKPATKPAKHTLLYVGSLNRSDTHKGVAVLLKAMQLVVEQCPDARLMLVGEGTGRPDFEAQAQEYGIAKHVRFTGGLYGKDLHRAYRQATVFVLPTFNDSFAMVVLEAMASGLPVVSTPVGAIPLQITEGRNGYLVPPGDSEALANKLIYLLQHPDTARRFGAYGRQRSENGFAWHAQAVKTHGALLTALQGTRSEEVE